MSTKGRSNHRPANSNAEVDDVPNFMPFADKPLGRAPSDFLQVTNINMLNAKNMNEHHTNLFSNPLLAVRRGQEFQVQITFDRTYDPTRNQFQLNFRIGSNPQVNKNTEIIVSTNPANNKSWQGQLVAVNHNSVLMEITPAVTCIVGKFRMYVVILTPAGLVWDKDNSQELYILFNPWAYDDAVFMSDDSEKEEYILNQTGIIFNGDADEPSSRPWNYGQFESGILDACLFLMDDATIPLTSRGDPIKVARQASAKVNSNDDNGVVLGDWTDDYSDGRPPTSWTGSVEILRLYVSSGKPVRYGQCWVFAGVLNTFLRAVGIPSRVTTAYNSAHDNNGNIITDFIVDSNGNIDKDRTKDSIWNYHCWNEGYMTRPDLPMGFGGWQVVDSTPQETSDGMYRCGPASVFSIKQGMIYYQFDSPFVFAEVNSDVVMSEEEPDKSLKVVGINKTYIGRLILTKEVGQDTAKDLTYEYKYPEGSKQERMAMSIAKSYVVARGRSALPMANVEIKTFARDVRINKDFSLTIQFKNLSGSLYNMDCIISGNMAYYTGVLGPQLKLVTWNLKLEPMKTVRKDLEVKADDYMDKLLDQGSLCFFILGRIKETSQTVTSVRVVSLKGPKLTVEVSGTPKVKEQMFFTVKFTNILKYDLKNVIITMEGPGVFRTKTKKYSLIGSDSTITWSESFTPETKGKKTLMACLDSALVRQVCDQVKFTVQA